MLRKPKSQYEPKRSSTLLKVRSSRGDWITGLVALISGLSRQVKTFYDGEQSCAFI